MLDETEEIHDKLSDAVVTMLDLHSIEHPTYENVYGMSLAYKNASSVWL